VADRVALVPVGQRPRRSAEADRWATTALVVGADAGEVDEVETVSIDNHIAMAAVERVTLVSIDVQRHEPAVLAETLPARERPALIVELNDVVDAPCGFADPDAGALGQAPWPAAAGGDVVLVPDVALARARVGR
jgi:hypothetical protein